MSLGKLVAVGSLPKLSQKNWLPLVQNAFLPHLFLSSSQGCRDFSLVVISQLMVPTVLPSEAQTGRGFENAYCTRVRHNLTSFLPFGVEASSHRGITNSPGDTEGPVAIDYTTLLTENEFNELSEEILEELQEKIEEWGEDSDIDNFDSEYSQGVLSVKLGSHGTYVLNKQTPNRQIWLSSPVSGPARFDWDKEHKHWVYRRTKAELRSQLQSELSALFGAPIVLQ